MKQKYKIIISRFIFKHYHYGLLRKLNPEIWNIKSVIFTEYKDYELQDINEIFNEGMNIYNPKIINNKNIEILYPVPQKDLIEDKDHFINLLNGYIIVDLEVKEEIIYSKKYFKIVNLINCHTLKNNFMTENENDKHIDVDIISYRKLVDYIYFHYFLDVNAHDNGLLYINIETRRIKNLYFYLNKNLIICVKFFPIMNILKNYKQNINFV